jgi:hypothetical protein
MSLRICLARIGVAALVLVPAAAQAEPPARTSTPPADPTRDNGAGSARPTSAQVEALRHDANTLRTFSIVGLVAGGAGLAAGGYTLHRAANPCAPGEDPATDCGVVNGVEYGMYTLVLWGLSIPTTVLSVAGLLSAADKARDAERLERRLHVSVAPLPGGAAGALRLAF